MKRTKAPLSNRKRGGQPGHDGHFRMMHEQPDEIIDLRVPLCEHCGLSLEHAAQDQHPFRHQVTELPEAPATVTEYRVHESHCIACGHTTSAKIPGATAGSSFGPRLEATVALLAGRYRMSHREIQRHSGIALMTPADVHFGRADQRSSERQIVLDAAYAAHPERFVRGRPQPLRLAEASYINRPLNHLPP